MIWLPSDTYQDRSPKHALEFPLLQLEELLVPGGKHLTALWVWIHAKCPEVSDFEQDKIIINKKTFKWRKIMKYLCKNKKNPRLNSLSTLGKGGNFAGQKSAQKRVATSTILRARHPCPVICSILSDTLPSPKSLHPSQQLLEFCTSGYF